MRTAAFFFFANVLGSRLFKTHLGEVGSFLASRVTTTNDGERFLPEDWNGTIADCASRDTGLPVGLFAGQVQTPCARTGRNDDRVGSFRIFELSTLAPVLEGAF